MGVTKLRLFRVLFSLSFILDATVIGLLVGIPLFLLLWACSYIAFGSANPFFVFKKWVTIKFIYPTNGETKVLLKLWLDTISKEINMLELYYNCFETQIPIAFKKQVLLLEQRMTNEISFTKDLACSLAFNIFCDCFCQNTLSIFEAKYGTDNEFYSDVALAILPDETIVDFLSKNPKNINKEAIEARDLSFYYNALKMVAKMMDTEENRKRKHKDKNAKEQFEDEIFNFEYTFLPKIKALFDRENVDWGLAEYRLIDDFYSSLKHADEKGIRLKVHQIEIYSALVTLFSIITDDEAELAEFAKEVSARVTKIGDGEIDTSHKRAQVAIAIYDSSRLSLSLKNLEKDI